MLLNQLQNQILKRRCLAGKVIAEQLPAALIQKLMRMLAAMALVIVMEIL